MRDSNYRAISSNKAAVTITTSLYDRRALDVTSDKPLVNSLNFLTYLVSSLAKVRETLSIDGGIERLIEILHECHQANINQDPLLDNQEKKLLTAWKWTLAFQCLVLIGTRGTEQIRQKVVKAGILPIIATVLDNYLSLHERTFLQAYSRPTPTASSVVTSTTGSTITTTNTANATTPTPTPTEDTPPHESSEVENGGPAETTPATENLFRHFQQQGQTRLPDPVGVQDDERDRQEQQQQQQQQQGRAQQQQQQQQQQQPQVQRQQSQRDIEATTIDAPVVPQSDFLNPIQMATAAIEATSISSSHSESSGSTLDINFTSDDYDDFTVEQLLKLIRISSIGKSETAKPYSSINNDIRRRYIIVTILNKLREEKQMEFLDDDFINDCDFDMDSNLQFLSDMYARDFEINRAYNNLRAFVRSFTETGVVIPRDDDIVWSLQLLAYISKYPYLKDSLQNTHLVLDMSIRDKQLKLYLERQMKLKMKKTLAMKLRSTITPKSRKPKSTYLEAFHPSASNSPQMVTALNDDNFIMESDKFELCGSGGLTETAELAEEDDEDEEDEEEEDDDEEEENPEATDDYSEGSVSTKSMADFGMEYSDYLPKLYENIIECESIPDECEREISLFQMYGKMHKYIDIESRKLKNTIIGARLKTKEFLQQKWNYEEYKYFDIDEYNEDIDDALIEYKKVSLFPLVEKFTFLSGTEMHYWAGVIMRNSCRRNASGLRQCGNCHKWEDFPRQFAKCKLCKRAKYCSKKCQMESWKSHRNWCLPS
ncbi:MYND-type zinc finger protein samB [Candida viswanathii]|uniref:MYND-type zinc finger protein samB n=1 Tax=Candida viswanathii TaxID=5486 RepID=A0A367YEL0_9ASCO|nr:MYND-type zinc finger protein samB [Candida viswanathii]